MGDGKDQMDVIFDTGSSLVWMISDRCTLPKCKTGKRFKVPFQPTNSTSPQFFEVFFGKGAIYGKASQVPLKLINLPIQSQEVIAVENVDDQLLQNVNNYLNKTEMRGVIGMSPWMISPVGLRSLMGTLINRKQLNKNIVTFYMDRKSGSKDSWVHFGNTNWLQEEYEIDYYNVLDASHWTIKLDEILIDDKPTHFCSKGCTALIDTGTSLILGPDSHMEKVNRLLLGNFKDSICKNASSMPKIT